MTTTTTPVLTTLTTLAEPEAARRAWAAYSAAVAALRTGDDDAARSDCAARRDAWKASAETGEYTMTPTTPERNRPTLSNLAREADDEARHSMGAVAWLLLACAIAAIGTAWMIWAWAVGGA